ncbi:MAG TPA: hypothetical protein VFP84_21560 [Kofleriaceae bacterium]|nr:hypothetical protein [Kofleriaceae bacterium]
MYRKIALTASLLAFVACTDHGPPGVGDDLTDPELPARGLDDIQTWLAAGYYKAWACELVMRPMRSPSPHGYARVCNNEVLHAAISAGSGQFPVGAASVKEEYEAGKLVGFAVSRRLDDGADGNAWYWYERNAEGTFANSAGSGNCTGCHGDAKRDYVYTLVP